MTLLERLRAMPPGSLVPVAWLLAELEAAAPSVAPGEPAPNGGAGHADEESLLTVGEAAERLGVTPHWLYRHWRAVGGVKLGRKTLRFPAAALPRYLAARRRGGT